MTFRSMDDASTYCVHLLMGDAVGSSKGVVGGDKGGPTDVSVPSGRSLKLEGDLPRPVVSGGGTSAHNFGEWSGGTCCDKRQRQINLLPREV